MFLWSRICLASTISGIWNGFDTRLIYLEPKLGLVFDYDPEAVKGELGVFVLWGHDSAISNGEPSSCSTKTVNVDQIGLKSSLLQVFGFWQERVGEFSDTGV